MTAAIIRTKKKKKIQLKIFFVEKDITRENPIYHIIRAQSVFPSHLAEFYSHKEQCLVIEGACAAATSGLCGLC